MMTLKRIIMDSNEMELEDYLLSGLFAMKVYDNFLSLVLLQKIQ